MIIALVGEESLLVKRALERLLAEKVPPAARDFNFDRFDGKTLEVKKVSIIAGTLPVMADRRVILVQDAHELKKGVLEDLETLLPHIPKTTDLILVGTKIDRRLAFWKNLDKAGKVQEYKPPHPREVTPWVIREAKEAGFFIAPEAAQWIATAVGTDLSQILSSLEKIYLLKGKDRSITLEDVESCVTAFSWKSVFDLADAVGKRDVARALSLFGRMLQGGESPIGMIAILARHFRILLKVREGDVSGIPPFFLNDYRAQGQKFSKNALLLQMDRLYEMDRLLKSSPLRPKLLFERLLLDLCRVN